MTKTTRTSALATLALCAVAVSTVLGYQALEPTTNAASQLVADARAAEVSPLARDSHPRRDAPVAAENGARDDAETGADEPAAEEQSAPPAEAAQAPQDDPAAPAPAPAPAPATQTAPSTLPTTEAQQSRLHEILNAQRSSAGLSPLARHPALDAAAQEWACTMVTVGLQHSSSSWRSPRLPAGWLMNGENVAVGHPTPERVSEAWIESPGHRENILRSTFTHVGTGWCYDQQAQYRHYWVQIFAQY